MFTLKRYQQSCLDQLQDYLRLAGQHTAEAAFVLQTKRPYRKVARLPDIPYVCLRVPTGGGKTVMACHALGIMTREHLHQERSVCLWLVPSNVIREQTLKALRDRRHPYRQAIDSQFKAVSVMDLSDALYVQRGVLDGDACIIVSTLAAVRKEDTEGRKIYESNGFLHHHFTGLPAALEGKLLKNEDGTTPYSLANVLRLWQPLVIMDEAHNARTKLSFEALERFNPSCIVEFTATPQTEHDPEHGKYASNVLAHVSAAELKAEHMIKLPIRLRTTPSWTETLADAVQRQRDLEVIAGREQLETGEYIRPIVLIQAQPHRQDQQMVTAEVIKKALLDDFKLQEAQVAVATGATREIDDVNLLDPKCAIRFIITQQALKEGWDCPFAYIFCSVADVGSVRDVEQLLGRVLRLPKATSKLNNELNLAYATVSSQRFVETLDRLSEALVENGFEVMESRQFLTAEQPPLPGLGQLPLFSSRILTAKVLEQPNLSKLDAALGQRVSYDGGTGALTVAGVITPADRVQLIGCFGSDEAKQAVELMCAASGVAPDKDSPGEPIKIPALCIRVGAQLEMLEESHFIDAQWDLSQCDPTLSETDFPSEVVAGSEGELDVSAGGKVVTRFVDEVRRQLALLHVEGGWSVAKLVDWLDREIPHPDITRTQSIVFIHKAIEMLMESRHVTIDQLASRKYVLRDGLMSLINLHRQRMQNDGYQKLFSGVPAAEIETDPLICLTISQDKYAPNWYYGGGYIFQKHAFELVGELKSDGEEFECARYIDQLPQVKRWVRNLERRPGASFWLPTATDKFYPDFVANLQDGRILVVESKGEHLWSNDDSKEKRVIGEIWAERSHGSCLFVMPKGPQWASIAEAITKMANK